MQLVHCIVNLAGDPRYQAKRTNVSVPEVLVLRAIHGDDAVNTVTYAGQRDGVDEYEELMKFYGKKEEIRAKIERLFPGGPRAALPQTLTSVGLGDVATPELVEAFEAEQALLEQAEKDRLKQIKTARSRHAAALAEVDEAIEEEQELIRPPAPKAKVGKKAAATVFA